jgi:hypothetical protein
MKIESQRIKDKIEYIIKKEGGPHSAILYMLKNATYLDDVIRYKGLDIEDIINYIKTIRCVQEESIEEELNYFRNNH